MLMVFLCLYVAMSVSVHVVACPLGRNPVYRRLLVKEGIAKLAKQRNFFFKRF